MHFGNFISTFQLTCSQSSRNNEDVITSHTYNEVIRYDQLNIIRSLEALVPWFSDGFSLFMAIDY